MKNQRYHVNCLSKASTFSAGPLLTYESSPGSFFEFHRHAIPGRPPTSVGEADEPGEDPTRTFTRTEGGSVTSMAFRENIQGFRKDRIAFLEQ